MENEFEVPQSKFEDISIDRDTLTDEVLVIVVRDYIAKHMSPASLSVFDDYIENDEYSFEETVARAVFNETMLKILEAQLDRDQAPIPPFNI